MQIKTFDGREHDVTALERLLDERGLPASTRRRIENEIRQIQAGAKGEADAAYEIELWFGRSKNWATLHDLRIEVDGLSAQIDHLLINRLAQIWVCESKHFAEGVSVNEYGEWQRWWHGRAEGMPSPVEQNRRHIHLLQRVFDDGLVKRPRRLGLLPMKPEFRSLVLVSNNARIGRPRKRVDGLDEVIKAEQLKTRLIDSFDSEPDYKVGRIIGTDGLQQLARDLAALHRPALTDWAARFGVTAAATKPLAPKPSTLGATARRPWFVKFAGPCSNCGRILEKGTEASWSNSKRRMYCLECAGSEQPNP